MKAEVTDEMVNTVSEIKDLQKRLQRIRDIIFPVANRFYNDAPKMIEVPKEEMAALYVLMINNKNWE